MNINSARLFVSLLEHILREDSSSINKLSWRAIQDFNSPGALPNITNCFSSNNCTNSSSNSFFNSSSNNFNSSNFNSNNSLLRRGKSKSSKLNKPLHANHNHNQPLRSSRWLQQHPLWRSLLQYRSNLS